jgi:hypothetical protein
MSILIRKGKKCYEIPDSVLKKCEVSEKDFQKAYTKMAPGAEGQEPLVTVCDSYCSSYTPPTPICTDKPTYGASCGK